MRRGPAPRRQSCPRAALPQLPNFSEMLVMMHYYLSLSSPAGVFSSHRRWAAISGLTCLGMLILGGSLQLGNITVPPVATAPRQITVGLVGAVLLAASFVSIENAGPSRRSGVLSDPDFWIKVFDIMPPSFIKEYPNPGNLTDNQPFRTFHGIQPRELVDHTEFHALINSDHKQGDVIAVTEGMSVFLEFSDHTPTKHPQLILTFKHRIEHKDHTYIAGWMLPIDNPPLNIEGKDILELKKRGEQILFGVPASAGSADSPFVVNVGKAVRRPDLYRRYIGGSRRRL